jgi:hypothetical protein
MPPIHEVPVSGEIPVGPPFLRLQLETLSISSAPADAEFRIGIDGNPSPRHPIHLLATSGLQRISATGRPIGHTLRRVEYLSTVSSLPSYLPEAGFRLPPRPAFYRLDLTLADSTGNKSVTYSQYLRVAPPRHKVRLALRRNWLFPGGPLVWRIENLGTTQVSYGAVYSIDRRETGIWTPTDIAPESFSLYAEIMGAGGASECQHMRLPDDVAPGTYRVRKPADFPGDKGRELTAVFTVR